MGQGELSDETALKAMGEAAVGIITAFHYDVDHDSPLNKQFVAAYRAEFARDPDFFAVSDALQDRFCVEPGSSSETMV